MKTRRHYLCLAIALMICTSSFGDNAKQSKTRYYRHEVNVSIGRIGVRTDWSDNYERRVMDRFGLVVGIYGGGSGPGTEVIYMGKDEPDLSIDNPFKTISYYYHLNRYFAVGGLIGGCKTKDWLGYPEIEDRNIYPYQEKEKQKTGYTYVKGTSQFLMPSVKGIWLNNRWCSLYLKASVGFYYQSLHLDSEAIPSEQMEKYKKDHLGTAYTITPIGWEIGKQKVRWYMELGFGSNTYFQTGLTYRFRRF